ncbi:MAG: type II secretion system protein GspD [Candidatus Rifleibacteriota bacterium]
MVISINYNHNLLAFANKPAFFKRLDFQPGNNSGENNSIAGRYFLAFSDEFTTTMVKEADIPLFYIDILGAEIEKSPFVMNFSKGPVKLARLNQLSQTPKVIRATFFLKEHLKPEIKTIKNTLEIGFKPNIPNKNRKKEKISYSLIHPDRKSKIASNSIQYRRPKTFKKKKKMKIKTDNAESVSLLKELARQSGRMIHFRDSVIKNVKLDFEAETPLEAIDKAARKLDLTMSIEDGDIWLSASRNPILTIPESFRVKGVDLSGLALGDVLRALGQIAEVNVALDKSLDNLSQKPIKLYLKRMSVRRAFETILSLNELAIDKIDENSLLVLTKERASELEGKVVRVLTPKVPIETLKKITEKSIPETVNKRFSISEDMGNLILTGNKEAVDYAHTLMGSIENKILMAGEGTERKYFQPLNTKSEDLIKIINESLDEQENIKLTIDERTDTIIVSGAPESVKRAIEMMQTLDKPTTLQALIHIRLVEINRTDLEELGIKLPTTLVSTDNVGHIESSNYIVPAEFVANLENTNVKTLANPTLRCMNKEDSKIEITQQIPVKNTTTEYLPVASSSLAARTSDNWTTSEVGIMMNLTPTIHKNHDISMDVKIDQTELVSLVEGHPWTSRRQIETKVRVKDNETVVIGGLIRTKKDKTRKPVPLVNRIPLIRRLFRNVDHRKKSEERNELVVLITPKVIVAKKEKVSMLSNKRILRNKGDKKN